MVTAQDLINYIEEENLELEETIDKWLLQIVFPTFTEHGGYEIPKGVPRGILVKHLTIRGFGVKTHADHQGSFVYLTTTGNK